MAGKYKVEAVTRNCDRVMRRSKYASVLLGTVCRIEDGSGYTYRSFPILTTTRGPKKTQAAAIKAVVRDYLRWIG